MQPNQEIWQNVSFQPKTPKIIILNSKSLNNWWMHDKIEKKRVRISLECCSGLNVVDFNRKTLILIDFGAKQRRESNREEWENIRKNFLKSCRGLFAWPLVRRHSCTSLVLPDFRQKQGFGRPLVLCRSREAQKYGWVTGSTPWSRSGHVRSLFYPLFQLLKHFKPEYFQHSKRGILTQNQLNFHIFWKHQIWNT